MNRPLLPAAALLLPFLPLLLPESVSACSCMQPKPYAERRLDYASVFHGKTVASQWDEAKQLRWIRFDVVEDYSVQASGADTITVWTTRDEAMCGVDYPVGTEVLVFADTGSYPQTKPAGSLTSILCSGNASGTGLEQALAEMEAALGVFPGTPRPPLRRARARVERGQVLLEGKAQANGVLRSVPEKP